MGSRAGFGTFQGGNDGWFAEYSRQLGDSGDIMLEGFWASGEGDFDLNGFITGSTADLEVGPEVGNRTSLSKWFSKKTMEMSSGSGSFVASCLSTLVSGFNNWTSGTNTQA